MKTIDDLSSVVRGSKLSRSEFSDFATQATCYQEEAAKLEAVRASLDRLQDNDIVDFDSVFGSRGRGRVKFSLTVPLENAMDDFMSSVYSLVENSMEASLSTSKTGRNGVLTRATIQKCSGVLMEAMRRLVLHNVTQSEELVKQQTLEGLDEVRMTVCGMTIEHERAALAMDLLHVKQLAALVNQALQMASNKRDKSKIYAVSKANFSKVAHTFQRITSDPWFQASSVDSAGITALANQTPTLDAEETRFYDWLIGGGDAFHATLVRDYDHMQQLVREPATSNAWHNIVVSDTVCESTPSNFLRPPSYLKKFSTTSGHIHVHAGPSIKAPSDGSRRRPVRAIACVRALYVLRTIVERDWLPLNRFCVSYMRTLVDAESRLYSTKTIELSDHLAALCNHAGYAISSKEVARLVAESACTAKHRAERETETASGSNSSSCSAETTVLSSEYAEITGDAMCPNELTASSTTHTTMVTVTTAPVGDYLVFPRAIDRTALRVNIPKVHTHAMFEYAVVCALARLLWERINRSLVSGVAENLHYTSTGIASETVLLLNDERDILHSRVIALLAAPSSVSQHVSHAIRKVIQAGKLGCEASQRARVRGSVVWNVSYTTNQRGVLMLGVGYGSRDEVGAAFLELCLRLKANMEENWPLPIGVEWKEPAPRRGKRA
jgi:hypothetical protein